MNDTLASAESESVIYKLFKSMDLSPAVESDKLALSWLKEKGSFFGYVDGCWLSKEKTMKDVDLLKLDPEKVYCPHTGKYLCDIYTASDTSLLSYASKNSASGFERWSSLSSTCRSQILYKIAQVIEKYQQLFAAVEALSSGKQISKVRAKDIPNLIESFNYYAGCCVQLNNIPNMWFPRGPVCVVNEDYNNPSLTLSLRVSSVLASGNSVLLLPNFHSCLSAFLLAEICSEAGLPEGVLNVIPLNPEKLKTFGECPLFSKLIFIGSLERGSFYSNLCSNAHMPSEVLVPKRPVVIVYDQADLHSAANGVLEAFFFHNTRTRSSGCKVLVQESIWKDFLDILKDRFKKILVDENMLKTCFITREQCTRFAKCIKEAINYKAEIIAESDMLTKLNSIDFPAMTPMLITNLQTGSELVFEELGGPVLVTIPFRTVKESIAMFNCDNKGSPVSIWTEKISVALEVAMKLTTGVVYVNSENLIDPRTPFSGVYGSGNSVVGGKDALFSHMSVSSSKEISDQQQLYEAWQKMSEEPPKKAKLMKEGNMKEFELFIGGACKKSDNGAFKHRDNALIPLGTKVDIANAVSCADAAQPKWASFTDTQKRKVLFAIAENLKKMVEKDYLSEFQEVTGNSLDDCKKEVDEAIVLLHYWAMQNDLFDGTTREIKTNLMVLQRRFPIGVIGIQCPDRKPLLSFISMVTTAIVHGNAVVAIASMKYPSVALKLCEVFRSSNVPGGVINVVSGDITCLVPALCKHLDVSRMWFADVPHKVIYGHCRATQRIFNCSDIWTDFNEAKSMKCTMESTYCRSIYLPGGDIFAN